MSIYWRVKGYPFWRYGYLTDLGNGLVRMGLYSGDTTGGTIVNRSDIETKPYK